MSNYKLIRHRSFDLAYANENIWYTLHEYRKTLFGKMAWKPVKEYFYDSGGGSMEPVRGNLDWAKSIAKELNIKVPTELEKL